MAKASTQLTSEIANLASHRALRIIVQQRYLATADMRDRGERNMGNAPACGASACSREALLLRLLLGSLFIAHLYWKFAILPGGLDAWWGNLLKAGYPSFVPAYVLSAELAGALLLIPGILTRYVACYVMPMMLGAAHFWMTRNGFFFTKAGAELPLVWLALLGIQAVAGDGSFAALRSPDPRWAMAWLQRRARA
jgi:putative oxidoreductase